MDFVVFKFLLSGQIIIIMIRIISGNIRKRGNDVEYIRDVMEILVATISSTQSCG